MNFNNNFQIDYDCSGFCAACHTEVAEFKGSFEIAPGIFKPKVTKLKANHRSQLVYLSDGSQMTVSVCENCYNTTPEKLPKLMESVVKGWEKEVEILQAYVETKKDLTIIDVPDMKWDENIKEQLSKGVDNGSDK